MDAFAVAVTNGLTIRPFRLRYGLWLGLYFALAQWAMPLLGYALGSAVAGYVRALSPYVSFCLLGFIGGKMLWEAAAPLEEGMGRFSHPRALAMALATSIDAMAVGLSFAFSPPAAGVFPACCVIGAVTFALCLAGSLSAGRLSLRPRRAMALGGAVLCLVGLRLLLTGLGLL